MVVGENGVLNRATSAADKTNAADVKSALENAIMGCQGEFVDVWESNPDTAFLDWLSAPSEAEAGDGDAQGKAKIEKNLDKSVYTVTYTASSHEGSIKKTAGGDTYNFTLTASGKIGAKVSWK